MDRFEFFIGDRTADSFDIDLHDGRAKLSCTIVERWEELFSRSLTCGAKNTRTVTQRFGISSTEHEDLEATIKGSLGLKGIAELKSEVKGKAGRELNLEESREVREKFEFEAPKCGQLNLQVYQLKRIYKLVYQDSRFWHAGSWTKAVTEYTNRISDVSNKINNDPACGCEPKPESGSDGLLNLVVSNHFGMLVGYKHRDNSIDFPSLRLSIPSDKMAEVLFADHVFRREVFPPYLLFLAGENGHNLIGRFVPHVEKQFVERFSEIPTRQGEMERSWEIMALERQRRIREPHRALTGFLYFLIGGGIGALSGILLAPKSRNMEVEEARKYAQRKARELRERAEELIKRGRVTDTRNQHSATKDAKADFKTHKAEEVK